MALLPFSYSHISRSQWVTLVPTLTEALPRVEVRQSAGRGLGLFAVDHIPAFSRILEDHTLIGMVLGEDLPQLWDKYLALPQEDRETFDSLSPPAYQTGKEEALISKLRLRGYNDSEAREMARVSSRFQGNAFSAGMNGGEWTHGSLLYPTVARINHSCTPNVHSHFRASSGADFVYALRDIQPGEEIEISYLDLTMPRARRQHRATGWSFECRCPACSGTIGHDYESQLALVHPLKDVQTNPTREPGRVDELRRAIAVAESDDFPWLRMALTNLYANLAGALGDEGHGMEVSLDAARKALMWQERVTGPDSPRAYFLRRDLQSALEMDGAGV